MKFKLTLNVNCMKRITLLLTFILYASIQIINAQTTVSGTVTGKDDGAPLPGVSILAKGVAGVGTITDVDGKYKLEIPEGTTSLIFAFVGMRTIEEPINGRSEVSVVLESDVLGLDEVVVTALGITKAQKAVGYSVASVDNAEITRTGESNIVGGLRGKVAGVVISSTGGGPGSSTKVTLRGYSSIYGNNNPLYVVDGSPISNETYGTSDDGVDFGNGANSINPDDVESYSILKGAAATALYGSRAANGVIIITTKKGKASKKMNVVYSNNTSWSSPLRLPQFQNVYGQGWDSHFAYEENGSWGPQMDGKMRLWGAKYNNTQKLKPYKSMENNLLDFYEKGLSVNHNLSMNGGNENSNFYLSYSNLNDDGIVPGDADKYKRNTFAFRGSVKTKNVILSASTNYVKSNGRSLPDGRGGTGSAANLFSELLQIPRDMSIVDFKDYKNDLYNSPDYYFTWYAYNPYYALENNKSSFESDRFYGNFSLDFQIAEGLKATYRLGSDVSHFSQINQEAILIYTPGSYNSLGGFAENNPGYYSNYEEKIEEINSDLILSYAKKIGSANSISAILGHNVNQRHLKSNEEAFQKLDILDFYSLSNSPVTPKTTPSESQRRLYGVFGQIDYSFKEYLFLTTTFRNDWSSTLPQKNNSYFYWGANSGFVFSEAIQPIKDYLSFGKIRVSYGKTGKDADPYLINTAYNQSVVVMNFGDLTFPLNGVNGFERNNNLGYADLKPEISTEVEFGLDLKFFNNRLGFDFAYYDKTTKDQIIQLPLPTSTGYWTQTRNIGKIQNKGIELMLHLVPVKTNNFEWNLGLNYTKNTNKVLELTEGLDEIVLTRAYSVDFVIQKGQPLGLFKAPVAETDPQGRIVVNSGGFPLAKTEKEVIGSAQPKYILGITSEFKYKGFTLGIVFDYRKGGLIYSGTADLQYFAGNATQSLYNNRQPFIIPNSVYGKQDPITKEWVYSENVYPVDKADIDDYYYHTLNSPGESKRILDKTYLKLRELVLSYSLPKSLVSKLKIANIEMAVFGRNLLLWTPQDNNFIDPEVSSYGNDLEGDFGEFRSNPTLRSYGFNIKFTF